MCKSDAYEMTLAFQRGEEIGFNFFYRNLYPNLCYYAFRFLNDREEAKDKVDIAFVTIWKLHSGFDSPNVIKTWLYSTVRNGCLNHMAHDRLIRGRHKDILYLSKESDERNTLSKIVESETFNDIISYLDYCSPQAKQVLYLIYFEGLNTKQVAEKLVVSESCVKTQKANGLSRIRKMLRITKQQYEDNCKVLLDRIKYSSMGARMLGKLYGFQTSTIQKIKSGKLLRRHL
jgi:RNA polymerase sigma factor (sigma-70 family)